MIIAIDVKDLLALDAEHTAKPSVTCIYTSARVLPREHAFGEAWDVLAFGGGGSGGVVPPVPSTTTSYSGAISSMMTAEGMCKQRVGMTRLVCCLLELGWMAQCLGVAVSK